MSKAKLRKICQPRHCMNALSFLLNFLMEDEKYQLEDFRHIVVCNNNEI